MAAFNRQVTSPGLHFKFGQRQQVGILPGEGGGQVMPQGTCRAAFVVGAPVWGWPQWDTPCHLLLGTTHVWVGGAYLSGED